MLRKILTISGKPGLYRLLSNGRSMLIVETLDATHKRLPVYATDKVVSLGDIAMYTDSEEVPLWQVMENVKARTEGKPLDIDYKQASNDELAAFFAEVLPNYDRDRVYMTHVRKLIQWYNILINEGITEFKPSDDEEVEEESEKQA
ncbi:MAG: DUF5606 domain-containing protein [Bacteroidaceae bacterium]|nr:DUF5606 domain-containing protein [Bacteroidaceae bacterium]